MWRFDTSTAIVDRTSILGVVEGLQQYTLSRRVAACGLGLQNQRFLHITYPYEERSMRLSAGQAAPDFEVTDISTGKTITLADFRGHKLLLSFHRYAACPFCNLHVHELSQKYSEFEKQGLKVLALFRSQPDRTLEQYGSRQVPFQIAADPKLSAYRAYGIEQSLLGMLVSFIHPRGLYATLKGFLPGKVDGEVRSLPADFLVTPDQKIARAYYSSNITQHLSLSEISDFARKPV